MSEHEMRSHIEVMLLSGGRQARPHDQLTNYGVCVYFGPHLTTDILQVHLEKNVNDYSKNPYPLRNCIFPNEATIGAQEARRPVVAELGVMGFVNQAMDLSEIVMGAPPPSTLSAPS